MDNVIVTVRTRDAEIFIERFCKSYQWVNKILIADGGSEDRTKEIASQFPNVEIRDFTERVYRGEFWRNPHGKHINFLIDWAESYGADWIIFDDVDCVPNYAIKNEHKYIFESASNDGVQFILANRVYIYGEDTYFLNLTCPKVRVGVYESKYIPSLWAWKTGLGFRASEKDPFVHDFNHSPIEFPRKELYPPYCLLHYFFPNDEYMDKKIKFYNDIYEMGENVVVKNPKQYGGVRKPLEEWMHE